MRRYDSKTGPDGDMFHNLHAHVVSNNFYTTKDKSATIYYECLDVLLFRYAIFSDHYLFYLYTNSIWPWGTKSSFNRWNGQRLR